MRRKLLLGFVLEKIIANIVNGRFDFLLRCLLHVFIGVIDYNKGGVARDLIYTFQCCRLA